MSRDEHPLDLLPHLRTPVEVFEQAIQFIVEGDSILDLGCGLGVLIEHLRGLRCSYRGIDLRPDVIRFCRSHHGSRAGTRFEVADALELDLSSSRYDVVAALNLLHLPNIDPVPVLRKAREALRGGGRLIVAGPSSPDQPGRGPGYYCSAEGMEALLRHLGFGPALMARPDLGSGRAYLVVVRLPGKGRKEPPLPRSPLPGGFQ